MVKLITLLEQHLDRQPLTFVIQASTWWETAIVYVKLQEYGLEVHLPARVGCGYPVGTLYMSDVKHIAAKLSTQSHVRLKDTFFAYGKEKHAQGMH